MSKWPESAVAVALIVLIAAVSVSGISRYTVEDFLKIWAALTGLLGIITGAIVTYFFTRTSLDNAERKLMDAERKLEFERERSRALPPAAGYQQNERKSPGPQPEDPIKEWVGGGQQRRLT